MLRLNPGDRRERLSTTILHNASSLLTALEYCWDHDIGSFRVGSDFFPLMSHPELSYRLIDLPESELILELLEASRLFTRRKNIRLIMHPDQFVVLSSPRGDVVRQSVRELVYHAELAELIGVDALIVHGGGGYGNKEEAIRRLEGCIAELPESVRRLIAFENDDKVYTPADLLPVCNRLGVPFVYDVHHHRCLPDGLAVDEVTAATLDSWDREPLLHISSPRDGWQAENRRPHNEYIHPGDFPGCWQGLEATVEVEAKAKEMAIARLQHDLAESALVA